MILAMKDVLRVTDLRKSDVTGPRFRQEQEGLLHPSIVSAEIPRRIDRLKIIPSSVTGRSDPKLHPGPT
jgi:hypothetical protein